MLQTIRCLKCDKLCHTFSLFRIHSKWCGREVSYQLTKSLNLCQRTFAFSTKFSCIKINAFLISWWCDMQWFGCPGSSLSWVSLMVEWADNLGFILGNGNYVSWVLSCPPAPIGHQPHMPLSFHEKYHQHFYFLGNFGSFWQLDVAIDWNAVSNKIV